ncbi:hypothetical protein [Streptomyces sp. NBC_00024]
MRKDHPLRGRTRDSRCMPSSLPAVAALALLVLLVLLVSGVAA